MAVAEEFMRKYPTIGVVYEKFAPGNWGMSQRNKDKMVMAECITLGQLDELYDIDGAAKTVVYNNLAGVYAMGMNRELMNRNTAEAAADLFVARYGGECSMYALMIYFSGYLMDYKGTYANYDVQDILGQFSKKFLPWWRQKLGQERKPVKRKVEEGSRGAEGLKEYLKKKAASGENLRSGGLWDNGMIDERLVLEIEAYVATGAF